eukprot:Skav225378  [mRNA]  locus=scaffold3431:10751:20960:+ [translate_table: standard]
METPPPRLPSCETNRQVSHLCSAELERFRQSFQQDAEQCLTRFRETMSSTGLGTICEQFLEARKADTEEVEKLRTHLEELLRLNAQLRQQTLDLLSAKELEKLHSNICHTCDLMSRLLDKMQKERASDLKILANDTAVNASKIFVEMMHNEWTTLKEMWHLWRHEAPDVASHFDAQRRTMHQLSVQQSEALRATEERILEKASRASRAKGSGEATVGDVESTADINHQQTV